MLDCKRGSGVEGDDVLYRRTHLRILLYLVVDLSVDNIDGLFFTTFRPHCLMIIAFENRPFVKNHCKIYHTLLSHILLTKSKCFNVNGFHGIGRLQYECTQSRNDEIDPKKYFKLYTTKRSNLCKTLLKVLSHAQGLLL